MHLANEVAHLRERARRRFDHDFDPFPYRVEGIIGDQNCNFNEGINREIEASHLAVNPDQRYTFIHPLNLLELRG